MPRYVAKPYLFQCGRIGRIQSLTRRWCYPGERIELAVGGSVALSRLRRPLFLDPVVDMAVFWTPAYTIYGLADWHAFIANGPDEAKTLGTVTVTNDAIDCLGVGRLLAGTHASWPAVSYAMEYLQWWSRPEQRPVDASEKPVIATDTGLSSVGFPATFLTGGGVSDPIGARNKHFGVLAHRLPANWNAPVTSPSVNQSDQRYSVSGDKVDLVAFNEKIAEYSTDQMRTWNAQQYAEVMRELYGRGAGGSEARIFRPQLLAHKSVPIGMESVGGTASDNLGEAAGVGVGQHGIRIPEFACASHGVLSVVMVLRIPPVHVHEMDMLLARSDGEPDYPRYSGDPMMAARAGDELAYPGHYFRGGNTTTDLGRTPANQHMRMMPSIIHPTIGDQSDAGFPFVDDPIGASSIARREQDTWDSLFVTRQFEHWHCAMRASWEIESPIPAPFSATFSAANMGA